MKRQLQMLLSKIFYSVKNLPCFKWHMVRWSENGLTSVIKLMTTVGKFMRISDLIWSQCWENIPPTHHFSAYFSQLSFVYCPPSLKTPDLQCMYVWSYAIKMLLYMMTIQFTLGYFTINKDCILKSFDLLFSSNLIFDF